MFLINNYNINSIYKFNLYNLYNYLINNLFGDWGLGIGDWAQSPIPNPQSPLSFNTLNFNFQL